MFGRAKSWTKLYDYLVVLQYFFLLFANYNTRNVASSYNYKSGTAAFVV